jgi:thiol-disulfide isomerase/thioredoxin
MMKRLVMTSWVLVIFVSLCSASNYTQEALMKSLQTVQAPEEAATIFCDFVTNAPDIEFAHQIFNMWRNNDPDAAETCLNNLRTEEAHTGRVVYFTGAQKDSLVERIAYSRRVIDEQPELFEAYALMFDTYTGWLFKQSFGDTPDPAQAGFSPNEIEQLESGFHPDNAKMAQVRDWKNAGKHVGEALKYMGYYAVYKNRYDDAFEYFTEADALGADWVDYSHVAVVAAKLNKLDKVREYVNKSVSQWIQRGVITEAQRDMLTENITMYALINGAAYDAAIEYITARDESMKKPDTLFKLAGLYNQKGDTDKVFETLEKAVEKGFDSMDALTNAEELESLHTDSRWAVIVDKVQAEWDKGEKVRAAQARAQKIEKNAPDWELKDADQKTYKLSDYKGEKVVILDFWATWCSPCMMVLPDLDEWTKNEKPDNVVVFCINTWERQPDKAKKLFADNNYAMRLLMNGDETSQAYGLRGVPYICVIDKEGKIRYELSGYTPDMKKHLTYWVNDLLE